jgi:hypothetical protein
LGINTAIAAGSVIAVPVLLLLSLLFLLLLLLSGSNLGCC